MAEPTAEPTGLEILTALLKAIKGYKPVDADRPETHSEPGCPMPGSRMRRPRRVPVFVRMAVLRGSRPSPRIPRGPAQLRTHVGFTDRRHPYGRD